MSELGVSQVPDSRLGRANTKELGQEPGTDEPVAQKRPNAGERESGVERPATISVDEFLRVDIRVGKVVRAEPFPEARKPSLRLWIDFGPEFGERKSSAQIAARYNPRSLIGRLIFAVVNFPPLQIGPMRSEVLVLGVLDSEGEVILVAPDGEVPVGARLH